MYMDSILASDLSDAGKISLSEIQKAALAELTRQRVENFKRVKEDFDTLKDMGPQYGSSKKPRR